MARPGIRILDDAPGHGDPVERQHVYRIRFKLWLNNGDPVTWDRPFGLIDRARLEDGGATVVTDLRIDRENLFAGLFQGIDGMCIGGRRRLKISPHLAYGERGIPGRVPPNAAIVAEIEFIEERTMYQEQEE